MSARQGSRGLHYLCAAWAAVFAAVVGWDIASGAAAKSALHTVIVAFYVWAAEVNRPRSAP